jgi:hypothetical protein
METLRWLRIPGRAGRRTPVEVSATIYQAIG